MKRTLLVIITLFFAISLFGQEDYMIVYKPGKKHKYYYYIGDPIKVRPVRNFPLRQGNIYALSDSALYFSFNDSILYSEIEYIQIRDRAGIFSNEFLLYNAASTAGSLVIMELAYLVNTGKGAPYLKEGGMVAGVVTGIPLVIQGISALFRRTKCYIKPGAYKIGIVQIPKEN